MEFEVLDAIWFQLHIKVQKELLGLASCMWFYTPKERPLVFYANRTWTLPPLYLIDCKESYYKPLLIHLQVHCTLKIYVEQS